MVWLGLVVVVVLFVVAAAAAERVQRGRYRRPRGWELATALAMLAAGAAFWLLIAADPDAELRWIWAIAVALGATAVLTAFRPAVGARVLWGSAAVVPVLALAAMTSIYAFGSGVADGGGGTESFATMAAVALLGSLTYSVPAFLAGLLLRSATTPPVTAAAGWYPDPAQPGAERFWSGSDWTDDRRPVAQPPVAAGR
jgi:uncharacterized membrane protein YoaK (UPF0700 family)